MHIGLILVAALVAAGCGTPQPPVSQIDSGPDGLRTFTWVREVGGVPMTCGLFAAANPVSGVFRGDASASAQPAWLEAESGRRMSVIWPAGFTIRFAPDATLHDEAGRVVARDGDRIRLGQVSAGDHAGTFEDPYIASGLVFDGCYPYVTST